jgi:hypothetical protein
MSALDFMPIPDEHCDPWLRKMRAEMRAEGPPVRTRWRVWDQELGKLFGTFDDEQEALALEGILRECYGEDADDIMVTSSEH